ncbi:MAG: FG-GAP repeat protein [Planctomycetes bacterium]|nr:FG-GAP repeat protein [Planctomycetota bacterium]
MNSTTPLHLDDRSIALPRPRGCVTAGLTLVLVLAIGTAIRAEPIVEQKIIGNEVRPSDRFGRAVGISGGTAIVGAPATGTFGVTGNGSAYLFDVASGAQRFKLTADDGATGDDFGGSVAISGNRAIVGARWDDDEGPFSQSGSAYLFDATSGQQLFKLTAGDDARGADFFGTSVAIDGNMAIVGAPEDEDSVSAAYLFDVTTGERLARLTSRLMHPDDQFGRSVAISGNRAIVGADRGGSSELGGDPRGGTAYVFDVDPQSPNFGQELFKLSAADAAPEDRFGWSVAISGNRAIVGTRFAEAGELDASGLAYVFDVTTGEQLFRLTAGDDSKESARFGASVSISGHTAIIGAHGNTSCRDAIGCEPGTVYLFDVFTGRELARITASDADDGDFFGFVAIDNGTAIVGAPGDNDLGSGSGSAYILTDLPRPIPEPSSLLLAVFALLSLSPFARCCQRRMPRKLT